MVLPRAIACLASLSLAIAPPLAAQVPGAVYTVVVPAGQFGSSAFLTNVLSGLTAARAFCSALKDPTLNVDCLAERLGDISGQIPSGTDYDEVRSVLNETSKKLNQVAKSNRAVGRGPVKATQPGTEPGTVLAETSRPLTPIRPDAVAAANQQAIAILEEAETILLRSAETNSEKRTQYARIADALDSNKVLLRSA